MIAKDVIYCFIIYFISINYAYADYILCLKIKGIKNELLANANIAIGLEKNNSCFKYPTLAKLNRAYHRAPAAIKSAIEPFGYFHPTIISRLQKIKHANWLATYCVKLNKPVLIKKVSIEINGPGKKLAAVKKYLAQFPINQGDTFNSAIYNDVKTFLFNTMSDNGYIKARFQNSIIVNIKTYQSYIKILLYTGHQYYFGAANYPCHPYSAALMRKLTSYNLPYVFSSRALIKLQQKMENSDYFKTVEISPRFNQSFGHKIPIKIDYTVPKKFKFIAAVGYGTLTGPKLSAGMSIKRLTENGAHFESELALSQVLTSLNAYYIVPEDNPLNNEWSIGLNTKRFSPKNGYSQSATLSGGYATKNDFYKTTTAINLLIDRYFINGPPYTTSHLFYPSLKISYLNVDNLTNPKQGANVVFYLAGGAKQALATTNFIQSEIRGSYFFNPIAASKLIVKTNIGYTSVNNLTRFPLSLRFFTGGINNIRGFAQDSIGPGRYLYTGSLEYRNKIKNDLYGALFYDAGTATDHFTSQLNRSFGIGLVYETIIGPCKVYLSRAVSKKSQPHSIEFSVGPEFQ